ncbi:MAG TPA: DUF1512 domain-containing protein [Nitrososphaerales archaeon]|nr:DUF1512 domain-containing protein [Nitrososphaerales archaeon]
MQLNPLFPTGNDPNSWWMYLIWILPTFIIMMYFQRIQMWMVSRDVARSVTKLKVMREQGRKEALEYAKSISPNVDQTERVDRFLEYFTIMPVDMDPSGIMKKLQHIMRIRDDRVKAEVKAMAPNMDIISASKMENILEAATILHLIYKVVRHFYLMGKKTSSMFFIIQLQMIMPILLQEAEALTKAIGTFRAGQPIGDGIGPMIVGKMMLNKEKRTVAKETVVSEDQYSGRTLYLMKAEGPAGSVGEPGTAVEKLIDEMGVKINSVIMIDAALKLEGEKTGELAEGVGAAIGGIGVDRFQIEEVATKHGIPVYAIIVKQSVLDAITVMKKEIAESIEKVSKSVFNVIDERTKEGDSVLIIGVGNTLGVAQ